MNQPDHITVALEHLRKAQPIGDPTTVICYLPGTLIERPKGDLISGQTFAMLHIHPDGTHDDDRKWVRARGPLARWALDSPDLTQGARIVAIGHPAAAPKKHTPSDDKPWILHAQRITVDLWHQAR